MTKQRFADTGQTFDMDNIKGDLQWGEFINRLKDGEKGKVLRLRFLMDKVHGSQVVADLSYCYVELDGEIFNVINFPMSWYGGARSGFKRELYKLAKSEGVFIPNLFDALSIF